ncbi:hypothetical protein MSAN_00951000 [Mycena sanguinolenta]|uniref:Uncharacterized protein n=1 Tax=Mycena sanguinolenta TaxID=230812 RepID=A0A8H6YV34_9AGAR|nr:hypothetical protein MSAN_00951000 [Mycena sanguinolenta]
MPRQPTVSGIQLENLAACLTPALTVLNELHDSFAPPFILPIANAVTSLINLAQNVKQNAKECTRLLENVHQVIYTIISLHIKSETPGSLPPAMMDQVGTFMKTLHKIYIYIEAQQDRNKFKQLFRYNEMNNILKDCYAQLDQAMQTFEIRTSGAVLEDIAEMKNAAENMHKELLELISNVSETETISGASSH